MDDLLRRDQRALEAAPDDRALRERVARGLVRAGRVREACDALAIRWDVDPAGLWERERPRWRGRPVELDAFAALVQADLDRLDPLALAAAFPKRADGRWRAHTTRFLRRYPAKPDFGRHRQVLLLAWTFGTIEPPPAWGGRILCLSLDTRSTQADYLPEPTWTR